MTHTLCISRKRFMYFQMKTIMVWYLRYFSYQKDPKRPQFQSNTSDLLNLPGIFLKRSSSFFSYVYVMFMLMLNLNKILKTKFNSNVSLMSQIKSFSKIESFIFFYLILKKYRVPEETWETTYSIKYKWPLKNPEYFSVISS